jgi:hypothetical protein
MRVTNVRATFLLLSLITASLMASLACAPPSTQGDGSGTASNANEPLEITDEMINERINGAFIRDVPEENGTGEPTNWTFIPSEPKEITVVDKQVNGDKATIILDIKTSSSPRSREQRYLEGQIRTEWELRTGWVLRQWEIVNTENISMKYKNLPSKTPEDSNR